MDLNVENNVLLEIVEFCNDHSLESTGLELYKVRSKTTLKK